MSTTSLRNRLTVCTLAVCAGIWSCVTVADEPVTDEAAAEAVDFVRDIQPLLTDRCVKCHGEETTEGGLRLDRKDAALAGGDDGVVITAGKSDESLLLRLVAGLEDDRRMPPEDEGEPLSDAEIELVRRWIDAGASWPDDVDEAPKSDHWAYQPIGEVAPPDVHRVDWVRNPIDRFVLARLESAGVQPSAEADRATLIRRLSFDLLGLPPTPEEVRAFVLDNRPDAYERLVERLLASEHYGERFARHWLDLARYADSDGYEKDRVRPWAWRYRDWVISAINRDLPFDEFTIEQIAGDLLPNATLEQKVATGFHRNTLTNTEGGVDQEEFRAKANVDRVGTTAAVWLGLTLNCCECHSHKYDPFTQREFYGLYAFFNNAEEKNIPAPYPDKVAEYKKKKAAFDEAHAKLVAAADAFRRDQLPARQAEWEASLAGSVSGWQVLVPESAEAMSKAELKILDDGSVLASGESPETDEYTVRLHTDATGITGVRLEAMPDESLPSRGPGRVKHGNFVLSEFTLSTTSGAAETQENDAATGTDNGATDEVVELSRAVADFSQDKWDVAGAIDGDEKTGWAVQPQLGRWHEAVFEPSEPFGAEGGTWLTVRMKFAHGDEHTLGRFRLAVTTQPGPLEADSLPSEVEAALTVAAAERSDEQRAAVTSFYETIDEELGKLDAAVTEHKKQAPPYPPTEAQTLVAGDGSRETHVHIRGDFLRKGDTVVPSTPAVLNPLQTDKETPDRIDLAHWLVDPANPLTPRVTVNRNWRLLFGHGLVRTDEDFGSRGEPPTHPELLDWLARRFMDDGWSMKSLTRLIVTSATYRQSSSVSAHLAEIDPQNRLLARQNRYRFSAEIVRDANLAVSGLLNPAIGGPSIRPPLPKGVAELGYANSIKWPESEGADKYRRGLYIHIQRTVPYPMLTTFDQPDSTTTCTRRERSDTPLQALTLLNDPVFYECAQALGRRIVNEGGDNTGQRLQFAVRLCLGREATPGERQTLAKLHDDLLAACASDHAAAAEMVGVKTGDDGQVDDATVELAAWTAVGRGLLNLDEFMTRE